MVWRRHPEMCALSLVMGLVVAAIIVATLTLGKERMVWVAIGCAFALLALMALLLRPEVAGPVVFWFLLRSCPMVDGALFYFYTDDAASFPDGPHFSPWLYTTGIGLAGCLGMLLGYLTGSEYFASWRYQPVLLLSVVLRVLVRLLFLPVLWRWNLEPPHRLPDVYIVLPLEFFGAMALAWSWIPKQVMNAHGKLQRGRLEL